MVDLDAVACRRDECFALAVEVADRAALAALRGDSGSNGGGPTVRRWAIDRVTRRAHTSPASAVTSSHTPPPTHRSESTTRPCATAWHPYSATLLAACSTAPAAHPATTHSKREPGPNGHVGGTVALRLADHTTPRNPHDLALPRQSPALAQPQPSLVCPTVSCVRPTLVASEGQPPMIPGRTDC